MAGMPKIRPSKASLPSIHASTSCCRVTWCRATAISTQLLIECWWVGGGRSDSVLLRMTTASFLSPNPNPQYHQYHDHEYHLRVSCLLDVPLPGVEAQESGHSWRGPQVVPTALDEASMASAITSRSTGAG